MSSTKVTRKSYFLMNTSQPILYAKILILFLVAIVVSGLIFYKLSRHEIVKEYMKAHSQLRYTSEMFVPWLILTNAAAILIVAAPMVFFTHRIAGASFRIKKDLELVRKGQLSKRIRLRTKDELQDVAESLNLTLDELKGKVDRSVVALSEVEARVRLALDRSADGGGRGGASTEDTLLLDDIRRVRDDLQSMAQ